MKVRLLLIAALFILWADYGHSYNIFVDPSGLSHDAGMPAWLSSLGNTVTVASYTNQNLLGYDIVMDFGYDQWTGLNDQKKAAYKSYLSQGGSLYLQGEKPSVYLGYDIVLMNYLKNDLGAGNVMAFTSQDFHIPTYAPYKNQTTTSSPVTSDTTLVYLFDFALGITNPGNGFFVVFSTTRADLSTWPYTPVTGEWSSIIGFDYGQLFNAPLGKLIVNFDVTYLNTSLPSFQTNKIVLEKIVNYLGERPIIPSESTLSVNTLGAGTGSVNSNPTGIACVSKSEAECSFKFQNGIPITLSATSDWKSIFSGWGAPCSGTDDCLLSLDGDKSVDATFTENIKVRIPGLTPSFFSSITDAYNQVVSGDPLEAQVYTFFENLNLNRDIAITLNGGRSDDYSTEEGYSILSGWLIIEQGAVIINNLQIQ